MKRSIERLLFVTIGFATGCGAGDEPLPTPPYSVSAPSTPTSVRQDQAPEPVTAEISWETDADAKFATFLRDHSGGLIKKAAVGIEKHGEIKVEISRAVEPDDTLALTKSVMAGARKDFPDRPITLSLYDPTDAPILKARFKPGEGVHYQIAHGTARKPAEPNPPVATTTPSSDPLSREGATERDRAFAEWAESHGKSLIRYVQADLEHHGRLWFGINRDVKPEDVRPLTKSLLEGARKEFPQRKLSATVFDPEGERIGRATLEADDSVRWEQ